MNILLTICSQFVHNLFTKIKNHYYKENDIFANRAIFCPLLPTSAHLLPSFAHFFGRFLQKIGRIFGFWSVFAGQKPSFFKKVGMPQTQ